MIKKAVCLVSGGIDSCVTAYIAKNEGYKIYALSFNYGQKHNKEIECAKNIVSTIKAESHIIFDLDLKQFGGSSLLDESMNIEKDIKITEIGKTIPSTYVPARNTVFLSIALAYAEVISADSIFIGVTSTDYSGYPDCRPEYITAYQIMANIATKRGVEGNTIKIKTPLINLSKKEIIKKGNKLDAPFEKTWSCYNGGEKACGYCDSCILRLKGFKQAKINDPIKYEEK